MIIFISIFVPIHLIGAAIWFGIYAEAAKDPFSRHHASRLYARRARKALIWEWVLLEDLFDLLKELKQMSRDEVEARTKEAPNESTP